MKDAVEHRPGGPRRRGPHVVLAVRRAVPARRRHPRHASAPPAGTAGSRPRASRPTPRSTRPPASCSSSTTAPSGPTSTSACVDRRGQLVHYTPVPLPGPRLPHDMAITEHFVVLNDLPMHWDEDLLAKGVHAVRMHDKPTRFAVVPRRGGRRRRAVVRGRPHLRPALDQRLRGRRRGRARGLPPGQPVARKPDVDDDMWMFRYLALDWMKTRLHRWRLNLRTGVGAPRSTSATTSPSSGSSTAATRAGATATCTPPRASRAGSCSTASSATTSRPATTTYLRLPEGVYGSEVGVAPKAARHRRGRRLRRHLHHRRGQRPVRVPRARRPPHRRRPDRPPPAPRAHLQRHPRGAGRRLGPRPVPLPLTRGSRSRSGCAARRPAVGHAAPSHRGTAMEELVGQGRGGHRGASGIGLAMARAFAAEGMKVVLADIEADALDAGGRRPARGHRGRGRRVRRQRSGPGRGPARRRGGALRRRPRGVQQRRRVDRRARLAGRPARRLGLGAGRQPLRRHQRRPRLHAAADRAGRGPHREHRVDGRADVGAADGPLQRVQARRGHPVRDAACRTSSWSGPPGVGVSVLCPGWVNTRIHEAARNRPERRRAGRGRDRWTRPCGSSSPASSPAASTRPTWPPWWSTPSRRDRFYVLTHPDWTHFISDRTDHIVGGQNPVLAALPSGPGDDVTALEPGSVDAT